MLKSAATVLGFLFALSTAYYLSFWGYFAIDAFQFIAVTDIIKGVAYPLRFAGVWLLGIFIFVLVLIGFVTAHTNNSVVKGYKPVLWAFSTITVITFIFYWILASKVVAAMALSIALSFLLMCVYFLYTEMDDDEKKKLGNKYNTEQSPFVVVPNLASVYAMIFLIINAIVAGQTEARAIHQGLRYNYVMVEDFPKDKIKSRANFLIFLGAISEKYFFIDRSETDRFIIDKSELTSLKIHHFDATDKLSWQQYDACMHRQMGQPRN